MFILSFMQVMWGAQKCPISVKGNGLILALDFHLLKGVCGTLWLGDDSCFKNILILIIHLKSYNGWD